MGDFAEITTCKEVWPANSYDVAANETWLEDMARQGWFLTGSTGWSACFEKGEPRDCRYRMEPMPRKEKKPDPERVETYAALGWDYVTIRGDSFHIWRCDDPAAPELDTDPVVQAEGWRYIRRRMGRSFLGSLALLAVLAGLLLWANSVDRTPLLDAITRHVPGEGLLYILLFLSSAVLMVLEWRTMRRLLRRLRTGIPLERPAPYRGQRRLGQIMFAMVVCLIVLWTFGRFFSWDEGRDIYKHSDTVRSDVVYVDLRELEGAEDTEFWGCRTKVHELCPRMYETRHLSLGPWEGTSRDVKAGVETTYYRMLTQGLARWLAKELVQARPGSLGISPHGAMEPVPSEALDEFWWVRADTETQYVVARLGREVLFLEYDGPTDLRTADGYLASLLEN